MNVPQRSCPPKCRYVRRYWALKGTLGAKNDQVGTRGNDERWIEHLSTSGNPRMAG